MTIVPARPIQIFVQDRDRADRSKFYPRYFERLFQSNGFADAIRPVCGGADDERPLLHVINLGSPHRLSREQGAAKGGGFSVYDGLDRAQWAAIRNRGGKLIFDMAIEAFFPTDQHVLSCFAGADENGVDPQDVTILNSNRHAAARFEAARRRLGLPAGPGMVDLNACYWLIKGHNRLDDASRPGIEARLASAEQARRGERHKKFVSFNGRLRRHRLFVVLWMLARGYLDEGHVSLLGYSAGEAKDVSAAAKLVARYRNSATAIPFLPELLARMPLDLDVGLDASQRDGSYIKLLPWISPDPQFYDDSYFSVVVDTSFDDPDMLFLTPIAFKSMMNLSPFVYFGNAGALGELRALGFRTFAPEIDERYDEMTDHGERMAAALAELDRLAGLNKPQLAALHEALWPRLVHNYWHFHTPDPDAFATTVADQILATVAPG